MNKNFPEWYSKVNKEQSEAILLNRWNGIQKFSENSLGSLDVINLVRLFYQLPVDDKFRETFVNVFYEIDKAFPQKNEFELAVLAGATLVNITEVNKSVSNIAMLAVITLSFNNRKASVPNIVKEMTNIFAIETNKIRDTSENILSVRTNIPSNIDLLKNLETPNISPDLVKNFSTYFVDLTQILTELRQSTNTNTKWQKIYREDSQILWWMVGEWSKDLNKPLNQLKELEVAIIIGKELGDLVDALPGPYASKAVLHKILSSTFKEIQEKHSLLTAVNAQDKGWKQRILETYSVDITKEITPILLGLSSSLLGNTSTWKPIFKKLTGIDPIDVKLSLIEIAYQIYLECLVIKSIKNSKV